MIPPESFVKSLERQFNGQLRIRWSQGRNEWHIEQKFRRSKLGRRFHPLDDTAIRAVDGYSFVLAVRPGDRMPCSACGATLKVPVMTFGEAKCNCGARYSASYWPLSESLLEHLRKFDPNRGGFERLTDELDTHEYTKAKSERRFEQNLAEDIAKDTFTEIFDIPSVGYTGKEFK